MMKHNKHFLFAAMIATLASCADDEIADFAVSKPGQLVQYEYLNNYDVLKNYVDRTAHPNFHLGIALAASDFNAGGQVRALAASNFDEMTAGNAMKYASCVSDNGSMDFSTVSSFVSNAQAAGMTIYGHTLAWHSQQNNKYLNELIAGREIDLDEMEPTVVVDASFDYSTFDSYNYWGQMPAGASISISDEGYLHIFNPEVIPNFWEFQYHVADGINWLPDLNYSVTMMARASETATFTVVAGTWGASANTQVTLSSDWQEISLDMAPATEGGGFIMFQSGNFAGTIEVQWIRVTHEEAPSVEIFVDQLTNGEMASGQSMDNFIVRESGKGDVPGAIIEGQGPEGMNCTSVTSIANPANPWDTQFFITSSRAWAAGERYRISFWYKASEGAGCETQCHGAPGSYMHWAMLPSNPTFTTDWQYYEATSTIPAEADGMQSIAFNLNVSANAVTYYFADVHWQTIEAANRIPLTDEEKKDTLTWAMDNWITGMMEATGGYVTAWDAVNEAISGTDGDGDGYYDLQSAENGDASSNFYWQDYLGNDQYVPIVTQLAAQRFAENGGNASDLKLFINDYNLESWWDNNKKLESLIHWIEVWEANGAKIDGIGTQMHVSLILNPQQQQEQEAAIVRMFERMRDTGKLIKISELDMGIVENAFGTGITTANVTFDQQLQMAEFYRFIIEKYFEIIPPAQQYGITQWCATDSPSSSGWRGGEPVGLWDSGYSRKPTYGGFANGLAGKEVVVPYAPGAAE